MAGRFEGKVAVITGGGRGIGRDTALLFAREGARVVVNDLGGEVRGGGSDASVAQAVVDEITAAGGQAMANGADVATMDGAKSVIDDAARNYGRVDVLFNGAGILKPGRIDKMDEATWDAIIRVNLKSAYAMTHFAAPHMIDQRTGSIISVTSPSGFGHYGMAAYAATKEGLVAFTRSIAREFGEFGVRANAIRPCAGSRMFLPEIADDMTYVTEELGVTPVGGQWFPGMNGEEPECTTEHVAAVIAWLSSPETEPLNGRVVYIAGGHIALGAEPELVRSRFNAEFWELATRRMDDAKAREPERYLDVDFRAFTRDQMATIYRIYDHFGLNLTAEVEGEMRRWLAANPRRKGSGGHRAESYGMSSGELAEIFTDYRRKYGYA